MGSKRLLKAAAVAMASVILAPAIATAETVGEFYKGKTLNVIVGFSPGGGFDVYGRMFSKYISKFIPGTPSAIVRNMPGASSLKAVKYVIAVAPPDGTSTVIFNPGLIAQSLTSPDRIDVDFSTLRYIGSVTSDVSVCYFWHQTNIRSMDDLLKRDQVLMGGTAVGSNSYIQGAVLRNMFGVKVKQVLGYPGSAEQRIAIERGELEGDCGAWGSIPGAWIKDSHAVPIVRMSKAESKGMPKIPYILDLAKSDEHKQILNLLLSSGEIGRPFAMASKVPEPRLAALREAFDKMLKDTDFLAEADKGRRDVIGPLTGAEVEAMMKTIYATPKTVVAKARKMTN